VQVFHFGEALGLTPPVLSSGFFTLQSYHTTNFLKSKVRVLVEKVTNIKQIKELLGDLVSKGYQIQRFCEKVNKFIIPEKFFRQGFDTLPVVLNATNYG